MASYIEQGLVVKRKQPIVRARPPPSAPMSTAEKKRIRNCWFSPVQCLLKGQ